MGGNAPNMAGASPTYQRNTLGMDSQCIKNKFVMYYRESDSKIGPASFSSYENINNLTENLHPTVDTLFKL
jgi:hypothetical protein